VDACLEVDGALPMGNAGVGAHEGVADLGSALWEGLFS
jgi:hypothetical protein